MEKHTFKVLIDAPREKVWELLWGTDTYPIWTAPFCEGSHAVSDWQQGSKVLFMDGKKSGMISRVADRRTNEYMSFEHLGEVKDGVEVANSPMMQQYAGSHENYTLTDEGGKTLLQVDVDIADEIKDYMTDRFPKALAILKEHAEQK